MFDFSNHIVVITGVSGQLGSIYAKAFLKAGAKVSGLDMSLSRASEELASDFGSAFLFIKADVTDKVQIEESLNRINHNLGAPTVLINNAAIDSPPSSSVSENGPFEDYPEESWDRVIDVNLKGVYLCCQVFGAEMARLGSGSIINIASIYGLVSPDQSIYEYRRRRGETFYKPVAYSASKSGVLNLTRYLAVYWARQGVRVNTLSLAGVAASQDQEFLEAYNARIPIGRMAKPDEYTGAVLFLASDMSSYMTGSNVVIDGGWTAI